jgi:hypothetical protein
MASRSVIGVARGPVWAATIDSGCPHCGEPAFLLARSCPHCGGARRMGVAGMLVAGALALLLLAVVSASVVVLVWHQLAAATETGEAIGEPIAMGSAGDPSLLASAMSQCDAEAKADADTGTLHFLVTPLSVVGGDLAPWRPKAINESGNAIMLRADDALDGLRRGTLRLYPADYDFGVLDSAGDVIFQWRPSTGASKFSAADPGEMPTFTVRLRTAHSGSAPEDGGPFNRQKGACYWVNALIRQ